MSNFFFFVLAQSRLFIRMLGECYINVMHFFFRAPPRSTITQQEYFIQAKIY